MDIAEKELTGNRFIRKDETLRIIENSLTEFDNGYCEELNDEITKLCLVI